MKKYVGISESNEGSVYFIGKTDEIKALYKSISRHGDNIGPLYNGNTLFSPYKYVYCICIDVDGWMTITTSDDFALMLVNGEIEEE
jgi:hypothetical protein